jgi:hypothetical protein
MKNAEGRGQKTGGRGARAVRGQILQAAPAKELIEIRDCLLHIERMLVARASSKAVKVVLDFNVKNGAATPHRG